MKMPMPEGGLTPGAVNDISTSMKKASFFKFTVDPAALTAIVTPIDKAIQSSEFPSKQQSASLEATMRENKIANNDVSMAVMAAQNIIAREISEKAEVDNMKRQRAAEEAAKKAAEEAKKAAEEAKKQASAARASAAGVAASDLKTASETFAGKINSYNSIAGPPRMTPIGKNITDGKALVPKLIRDLKDAQKGGRRSRRGRSLSKRAKRSTRSKRSKSSKSSKRSKSSRR